MHVEAEKASEKFHSVTFRWVFVSGRPRFGFLVAAEFLQLMKMADSFPTRVTCRQNFCKFSLARVMDSFVFPFLPCHSLSLSLSLSFPPARNFQTFLARRIILRSQKFETRALFDRGKLYKKERKRERGRKCDRLYHIKFYHIFNGRVSNEFAKIAKFERKKPHFQFDVHGVRSALEKRQRTLVQKCPNEVSFKNSPIKDHPSISGKILTFEPAPDL